MNRADGISEIEGKGRRGDRPSTAGSEFQIRVSGLLFENGDPCVSRDNLNRPMKNAGVERRQFHAMSFGQFGQIQIGKFSAGLRGDLLRRKIVRDKSVPKSFGTDSQKAKIDTNCTNSHEFRRTDTTLEINWCKLVKFVSSR